MTLADGNTNLAIPRIYAEVAGNAITSIVHADLFSDGPSLNSGFELCVSLISRPSDLQWLSAISSAVPITIHAGQNGDAADSVIFDGLLTSISSDILHKVVVIRGTGWSYLQKNSTCQGSYSNLTSSEVVQQIATKYGFTAEIAVSSTMVGSFRAGSFTHVALNQHGQRGSDWDFLIELARLDGFDLFFRGRTLIYCPPSEVPRNRTPLDIGNTFSLRFARNAMVSGNTRITVKSWNSWLGEMFLQEASTNDTPGSIDGDGSLPQQGLHIEMVRPDLSSQDVERLAQQAIDNLANHGLILDFSAQGDLSMAPRDIITVSGVSDGLDGDYVVSALHRRFSPRSGFRQTVRAFAVSSDDPTPSLSWE